MHPSDIMIGYMWDGTWKFLFPILLVQGPHFKIAPLEMYSPVILNSGCSLEPLGKINFKKECFIPMEPIAIIHVHCYLKPLSFGITYFVAIDN